MDGYGRLYESMRRAGREEAGAAGLRLRLGRVLRAQPLSVEVAGTEQEAERFYIPTRLLAGEQRLVQLTGGTGGFTANDETHSVSLDKGTLALQGVTARLTEPALQAGDLLALLTGDDQSFVILDRVVKCG